MKKFLPLMVVLFASNAFAEGRPVVALIKSLEIKEYYCDVSGKQDDGAEGFNVTYVVNVNASDEKDAIKACLNKIDASHVTINYAEAVLANIKGAKVSVDSINLRLSPYNK